MDLVGERRAHVQALLTALPGAELRGSLAAGNADELSDIDLAWRCGPAADRRLADLPSMLERAGRPESIRLDPEPDAEAHRRLVFVRFADWPLWQRVDLELTGQFRAPSTPWSTPWCPAESALMNVLAAIKATRRGHGDVDGLTGRGFARIDAADPGGAVPARLHALVDASVAHAPERRSLAERVRAELHVLDA